VSVVGAAFQTLIAIFDIFASYRLRVSQLWGWSAASGLTER
jgi:hypothetical protein